ncbi:MAG: HDOD domain-containing protein [Candidatus Magnetobacterium sp. LHC-1]|uniref:HDOD domain-containing protein n=1 Tax=Candidatus Magnetobacterium casense TaxID=1455061 RepID=A0ABS6RVH6_9BACT|nr:HDOD domain-containing protein [Candidatus Magnetobacterium casensis]MBF0606056.1 HDOD domain-containing protein [Nitrospirota bacterium]MBV6340639.1 HDOD domain-containing protein [Candidatus Magnetobacterium casensis]
MLLIVSHSMTIIKAIEGYIKHSFPDVAFDIVYNDTDAIKKLAENNTYELIVSDWDYEYVDGHKLLVRARQDIKMSNVPFIIITQRRDRESIMVCLNASVTEYIMKPVENNVIEQKLKPYLEKLKKRTPDDPKGQQVSITSMKIPPCPEIVTELYSELKKPKPSLTKMIEQIKKDVSISALLIKLANSPVYASGKVDSVERALNVLGLNAFTNMVLSVAMQSSLKDAGIVSEKFWKHSVACATVCGYIASKRAPKYVDSAYLVGLFHDCAIPLFLKRFPDYEAISDHAMSGAIEVIEHEEEKYNSNHADIGSLIVKTWGIGDKYFKVIRNHHSREIDVPPSVANYEEIRQLWAILILAEHICLSYGYSGTAPVQTDDDFVETHEKVLTDLHIDVLDVKDFKEDAYSVLENISDNI